MHRGSGATTAFESRRQDGKVVIDLLVCCGPQKLLVVGKSKDLVTIVTLKEMTNMMLSYVRHQSCNFGYDFWLV